MKAACHISITVVLKVLYILEDIIIALTDFLAKYDKKI